MYGRASFSVGWKKLYKSMQISAVIITFNEAHNIGRCLASLAGVADEIVVVDSFSTDKTKEICLSHGVKFFENPFEGYTEQKNFAAARTEFAYVLSLDADEALSEELRNSILSVKHNPAAPADAYTMHRLTMYCGRWIRYSGWYPDTKVRLYAKSKGVWFGRIIHEYIRLQPGATTSQLKGDLLHYSFYTVEQHMTTVNKFSSLKAELLFEKGKRGSLLQLTFSPVFKFFRDYILKAGFLDGFQGFLIAANSAHGVFLKYAKLRLLHKQKGIDSASKPDL